MVNGDNMNPQEFKPTCVEEILEINKDFKYEELETDLLSNVGLLFFTDHEELKQNNTDLISLLCNIISHSKYNRTYTVADNLNYCKPCSYRSIGDLFLLAKYYRPKTTIREVYTKLYKYLFIDKKRCWLCGDIGKMVYFVGTCDKITINNYKGEDEFGFIVGTNFMHPDYYNSNNLIKIKDYGN